ncbi:unnamed protein product [Boreogadus saida]
MDASRWNGSSPLSCPFIDGGSQLFYDCSKRRLNRYVSSPTGLHREGQLNEPGPGGPPGPQTGPGSGPGPGQTMALVNSQGPRPFDPGAGPPLFPTEKGSSSSSTYSSSSPFSSTSSNLDSLSSQQTEVGVDCAGVVLDCLFCRFYDLLVMLPTSCERAVHHCCPTYKQVASRANQGPADGQSSFLDCGLLDCCQDANYTVRLNTNDYTVRLNTNDYTVRLNTNDYTVRLNTNVFWVLDPQLKVNPDCDSSRRGLNPLKL